MNFVRPNPRDLPSVGVIEALSRLGDGLTSRRTAFDGHRKRPLMMICGDLHNFGDLALLVQNLIIARDEGRTAFVRCWGRHPRATQREIERFGGKCVNGRNLFQLLRVAIRCDFVIGGGQLVRENTSLRALVFLWLAVRIAYLAGGGRVETRGLGVGPVEGAKRALWRGILANCPQVRVRDETSAIHAANLVPADRVTVTADMALHGDSLEKIAKPTGRTESVILAPCLDGSEARGVDPDIIRLLGSEIGRTMPGSRLALACHDTRRGMERDQSGPWLHAAGISAERFGRDETLARFLGRYRDARLVITNRLHAGIFALLFDKPLLVLDDGNPKLSLLTEIVGAPSLRLDAANDAETVAERLAQAMRFDPRRRHAVKRTLAARASANLGPPRIAIFNVKYSPNLGDGIIAECLEGELRRALPGVVAHSIDLAGRSGFDRSHGRYRRSVLGVREKLPAGLRRRLMPLALDLMVRYRLVPRWRRELSASDAAIIGGGALFADADQNFPIKLAHALTLCRKRLLPTSIASVGVTGGWSREGLGRVIDKARRVRLVSVTARDRQSAECWQEIFAARGLPAARVAPDPGLLCADHLTPGDRGHKGRGAATPILPEIGLCITDPMVLRLHGEKSHRDDHLEAWFAATIEQLLRQPCRVTLFTNGSPEDETFKTVVARHVSHLDLVEAAPQFSTPAELATFISGLNCVLAHRLHACIAAYSYRIPAIGFAWDRKVEHFFAASGRGRYLIDPRETSPGGLAALTWQALADPPDAATHERLLSECREGIAGLARQLTGAVR